MASKKDLLHKTKEKRNIFLTPSIKVCGKYNADGGSDNNEHGNGVFQQKKPMTHLRYRRSFSPIANSMNILSPNISPVGSLQSLKVLDTSDIDMTSSTLTVTDDACHGADRGGIKKFMDIESTKMEIENSPNLIQDIPEIFPNMQNNAVLNERICWKSFLKYYGLEHLRENFESNQIDFCEFDSMKIEDFIRIGITKKVELNMLKEIVIHFTHRDPYSF